MTAAGIHVTVKEFTPYLS